SLAYAAWVYGIARAGAILVPLNARLTASELEWQLSDAGVRLLVYDPDLITTVSELARQCPHVPRLSLGPGALEGDAVVGARTAGARTAGAQVAGERAPSFWAGGERTIRLADVHSILYTS